MGGSKELIGFHGCETWDLRKFPASLIPPSLKRYRIGGFSYAASSSGLVLIKDDSDKAYCYVDNQVLEQWVKIPPVPGVSTVFGLVTRVDEDGVVSSFKVIRGFVMYVTALAQKEETVLKIWRLNNDDESWQLFWEIGLLIIGKYGPMAMHPFDIGTVYLWSQQDHHLVSCNLRTQNYTIFRDAYNDGHQDCFIDQSLCDKSVDEIWYPRSSSDLDLDFRVSVWFFPFVLPRWMESVRNIRNDEYLWM